MTILAVCIKVAPRIGLQVPSAVFSSADYEQVQIAELANKAARKIANAYAWQKFKTLNTITGDGSAVDFDLPADYDWMKQGTDLWSSVLLTPLQHIPDENDWLELLIRSFSFVTPAWIMTGDQFHIQPAQAVGTTIKHYYQSNLIVKPASGSNKAAFTADDDSFRLSEDLLYLAMIYQWKLDKGLPYAEHMDDCEELKEKLISRDGGSKVIRVGPARTVRGTNFAYPGTIPE